jgi:hypothetical protein
MVEKRGLTFFGLFFEFMDICEFQCSQISMNFIVYKLNSIGCLWVNHSHTSPALEATVAPFKNYRLSFL